MIELFAIARNTFTQTIRQPVYCILILLTMLVLVVRPLAFGSELEMDRGVTWVT